LKQSRRQKRAAKKAEEVELYQKERSLLEVGKGPESAEDFDRLLLTTPNSSSLWVQYMTFHLHTAEVDKARAVAQRALRNISFRSVFWYFHLHTVLHIGASFTSGQERGGAFVQLHHEARIRSMSA
jgi:hypothetical protein